MNLIHHYLVNEIILQQHFSGTVLHIYYLTKCKKYESDATNLILANIYFGTDDFKS